MSSARGRVSMGRGKGSRIFTRRMGVGCSREAEKRDVTGDWGAADLYSLLSLGGPFADSRGVRCSLLLGSYREVLC